MNYLALLQIFKTSIKSLLANKVRSFLTMLGIIIGVAAVIVIVAVGAGAQSLILGQIEGIGTKLISITPGKSDNDGPPTAVFGIVVTTLNERDLRSLEENKDLIGLTHIAASVNTSAVAVWQSNYYSADIEGVNSAYAQLNNINMASGRFFTDEESRVVVLGSTIKNELFGEIDPVGERIRIANSIFEVIGVVEERGQVFFQDVDNKIFMPVRYVQRNMLSINYYNSMTVKFDDSIDVDNVINDISLILRDNHGIRDQSGESDDFTVRTAAELLDLVTTITDGLRYFLAMMAGLSLIVGGVGIMNIMLISVNERTREIGLRKALGATNRNIRSQFLLESIFLTLLGGLVGIVIGFVFSYLIYVIVVYLGYDWIFKLSPLSILVAIFVSVLVGLIFGSYPAKKASKLEPVEALSYE